MIKNIKLIKELKINNLKDIPLILMASKHEKLVKDYSEPHMLRRSLQYFCDVPQITEVYTERSLRDIFGINSDKLPDICAITENDHIFVGEVKGNYIERNIEKAQKQVIRYITTVRDGNAQVS